MLPIWRDNWLFLLLDEKNSRERDVPERLLVEPKKNPTKPLWRHCMDHPGHSFSPAEAIRLIWSMRDINLSRIVEAACINTFHCCNRAWPELSLSHTLSSFITHITGIKGVRGLQP